MKEGDNAAEEREKAQDAILKAIDTLIDEGTAYLIVTRKVSYLYFADDTIRDELFNSVKQAFPEDDNESFSDEISIEFSSEKIRNHIAKWDKTPENKKAQQSVEEAEKKNALMEKTSKRVEPITQIRDKIPFVNKAKPGTKLVCIDFDRTLVNGHFHRALVSKSIIPNYNKNGIQILQSNGQLLRSDAYGKHPSIPVEKDWGAGQQLIEDLIHVDYTGPKNAKEMAEAICSAIDNGHKVAITSYTLYLEVVIPTLKAILEKGKGIKGAEADKYINEIAIVGGFPMKEHHESGKNEHITAAAYYFKEKGFDIDIKNTMLIEDDENNIALAIKEGMPEENTVLVSTSINPDPNTYVPKIIAFVKEDVNLRQESKVEEKSDKKMKY